MTHVVTDNCNNCRFTECVAVCPVECFRRGDTMLYIEPTLCIDCGACVPVCPVEAIFDEFALPPEKTEWIETNIAQAAINPVIIASEEPLEGADVRRAELGFSD